MATARGGNIGSQFTRERTTGVSCSGSNGESSRVLTLASSPTFMMNVIVQGAVLMNTNDYTLSGTSLTFVNPIDNSDIIEVVYT